MERFPETVHQLVQQASDALEAGDTQSAISLASEAMKAGHPGGMYIVAVVCLRSGPRLKEFEIQAERLLRQSAGLGHIRATYLLGRLLQDLGRTDEATTILRKAVALGSAEAANMLGCLLWNSGEQSESEMLFEKAAAAGDTVGSMNFGIVLVNRGEVSKGREWLARAVAKGSMEAGKVLERLDGTSADAQPRLNWSRPFNDQTPDGWRYK